MSLPNKNPAALAGANGEILKTTPSFNTTKNKELQQIEELVRLWPGVIFNSKFVLLLGGDA